MRANYEVLSDENEQRHTVLSTKNWVALQGEVGAWLEASSCVTRGWFHRKKWQASEGSACHRVGLARGRTQLRMLGKKYVSSVIGRA